VEGRENRERGNWGSTWIFARRPPTYATALVLRVLVT